MIIGHPLSSSSIYNDPWHPLCSVYELDSPLGQPLSTSSLVFLLALYPQLHTPCISSPSHHHLSQHMHIPTPYRPGLTSMQHVASHTTTVQPSSHNQRHVLIGKQWYQLPELIPTNSNSGLHSCLRISIQTQRRKRSVQVPVCVWLQEDVVWDQDQIFTEVSSELLAEWERQDNVEQ